MTTPEQSRYFVVSRRALLKGSIGSGLVALTAAACGNADAQVLAGNVAEATTTTTSTTTTVAPTTDAGDASAVSGPPAVSGEMIVAFTYTRVGEGKIESPYVAVWLEDPQGDLVTTIALFFEQGRRGERWLDHLDRWFPGNAAYLASGGQDLVTTISSATQPPGEYAVTWDGTHAGTQVAAGDYFICIESTREDGPYSLIREPIALDGSLAPTPLPDEGELSSASVQIRA